MAQYGHWFNSATREFAVKLLDKSVKQIEVPTNRIAGEFILEHYPTATHYCSERSTAWTKIKKGA